MVAIDPTRLAEFRRAVRARIEDDLRRERASAEALRQAVLPALRSVAAALRAEGRVSEIWLFGSFAWGEPANGSDVDLLVRGCSDASEVARRMEDASGRLVHIVDEAHARPDIAKAARRRGLRL